MRVMLCGLRRMQGHGRAAARAGGADRGAEEGDRGASDSAVVRGFHTYGVTGIGNEHTFTIQQMRTIRRITRRVASAFVGLLSVSDSIPSTVSIHSNITC